MRLKSLTPSSTALLRRTWLRKSSPRRHSMSRRNGTTVSVMTLRFPASPTEDLRRIYEQECDKHGLKAVDDVLIEVQPELFSPEVEVTFRARVALKKNNIQN